MDFDLISFCVCMVNIKLNYNFVETPRKFIIAKISIRKLGSSSVLIIMLFFHTVEKLMSDSRKFHAIQFIKRRGSHGE